ncbi:phytoene/squalene synthase family protein [Halobium salinum]|uniref:Phytoene/squalene synthase family protein n=1 Tax=Halobium salinum TaxID=1364940 RepID=A0ABD5P889_9EURY|nr:phytoene/squalene synthase family protein [Halobium salinum]
MVESTLSESAPAPGPPLEWCHGVVDDVSRTFAISINMLDEPMSSYICVGYLLCRVPDTVEDAKHIPNDAKARLLTQYDAALDPEDDTSPEAFVDAVEEWVPDEPADPADWDVVENVARVFGAYEAFDADAREAMRPPIRELVEGMATFVERSDDDRGLRIADREELDRYCYFVAGTVGHLITNLTALETDDGTESYLRERAESFGLLLQLVNIAKDVHTDFRDEDNVYVPAEWLRAHGVPQDRILAPEYRAGAGVAVKRVIDHARSFRGEAREYLHRLGRTTEGHLSAWALPYLLAVATLRDLDANLDQVFTESSVKVSREEVTRLIAAFTTSSPDVDLLRDLEQSIDAE